MSLALAGCTATVVPKDGPTAAEIEQSAELKLADGGRLSYALVRLTPLVVTTMATERQPAIQFSQLAKIESSADVRIGPADTINITIFEASAGGLFIPTNSNYRLGDEVFMLLNLMGEDEKLPVAGRVIWVTPKGAQGKRTAGIGVQFSDQDRGQTQKKIETYLAGALAGDKATHTM
jgi:type IV pilus assembly protein PilZ